MLQRGRKPAAGGFLSVVQSQQTYPDPPSDLNRDERKVWRDVVHSKPSDWFDKDTCHLLAAFCRHVVAARLLSAQIDEIGMNDIVKLDKLLRMRTSETKSMLSLANAMRISQVASTKQEQAAVKDAKTSSDRPWQESS
jgi:hypothetical protein